MATYEFKCPRCSGNRLNEIMGNVTVDSEIDRINDEEGIVYGEQTHGDGKVVNICCRSCGITLTTDGGVDDYISMSSWPIHDASTKAVSPDSTRDNVTTDEELIAWLKKNK